jgi:excisionase family DNA binding protein
VETLAPDTPTLVIDLNEAAHMLRCGKSTVLRLIAAQHLDTLKIGRRRVVTAESLHRFVADQVQDGRPA